MDDSDSHDRKLRRVMFDGDVPVGTDGRRSVLISPDEVPAPGFGIASGASTAARPPPPDSRSRRTPQSAPPALPPRKRQAALPPTRHRARNTMSQPVDAVTAGHTPDDHDLRDAGAAWGVRWRRARLCDDPRSGTRCRSSDGSTGFGGAGADCSGTLSGPSGGNQSPSFSSARPA
ncbi:hypothetical protein ACFVYE_36015 [Streptomyces sp. NPDC058239]|uniref:hypothetical protein n=1 Tax=unclassified Streptomyces TaxID=2593676 RepID=UPI003659DB11